MSNPRYSAMLFGPAVIALTSSLSAVAFAQTQRPVTVANGDSIFVDGTNHTIVQGKAKGDVAAELKQLSAREMGPATLIIRSNDKLYIVDRTAVSPRAYARDPRSNPADWARDPRNNPADWARDPRNNPADWARDSRNNPADWARDPSAGRGAGTPRNVTINVYAADPYNIASYARDPRNNPADWARDPRSNPADWARDPRSNPADWARDPRNNPADWARDPRNNPADWARDPRNNPADWARDPRNNPADWARDPSRRVVVNDPDYVYYKLKKAFEENWTTNASTTTGASK